MPPVTTNQTNRRISQRSSISRRLFQDVDETSSERDNNINNANELIQQSNEDAKRKWNFDFVNEIPLDGDWIWEKIESNQNETTTNNDKTKSKD